MAHLTVPKQFQLLFELYTAQNSPIFYEKSIDKLLKFTKSRRRLQHLTKRQIIEFQNSLSEFSRNREIRLLRGRKRVVSTRAHKSWSPAHILCGDVGYFRNLKNLSKRRPFIVYMCHFSRFCYTAVLRTTTAREVANHLEKALEFFGVNSFKHFTSDRGTLVLVVVVVVVVVIVVAVVSFD